MNDLSGAVLSGASALAHLGNLSYDVGRKLHWNGEKEEFANDPEANEQLGRKARAPWDVITNG